MSAASSSSTDVIPTASSSPQVQALNRLLALPARELEERYRDARVPQLGDVRGDLRGRMLAWPALDARPRIASALRAFAGAKGFPWRGKSFMPRDARGEGINRVFSDRLRLFRFETFIARSRAGDFDALQLDYDLPENPPIIRNIKDEIREIEPGLWLGQAWFHRRSAPDKTEKPDWLWLYFGLATA